MEALKALQEKVSNEKLQPWLSKHGLDHLQGLWSRIHIEQVGKTRWKVLCGSGSVR